MRDRGSQTFCHYGNYHDFLRDHDDVISLKYIYDTNLWYGTSSGNHYSGEDFTSKLKSVNRLQFYLTTLIRHHIYSFCFPVKHMDFRENHYFAIYFQWFTLTIFREDNDSQQQLSMTIPATKPLNQPSFNWNPLAC